MAATFPGAFIVRSYRHDDLPFIRARAGETGWAHLTAREREATTAAQVHQRSAEMVDRALASAGGMCFVAESEGRIVAYELVALQRDEISGILQGIKVDGWVAPDWRRKGLNRIMDEVGVKHCQALGARRMVCSVALHNTASRVATRKRGYRTERVWRGRWLD